MAFPTECKFLIEYYDVTGKPYTTCLVTWELNAWTPEGILSAAVSKVRGLRDNGGPNALPGNLPPFQDGWDGPIRIVNTQAKAQSRILLPRSS